VAIPSRRSLAASSTPYKQGQEGESDLSCLKFLLRPPTLFAYLALRPFVACPIRFNPPLFRFDLVRDTSPVFRHIDPSRHPLSLVTFGILSLFFAECPGYLCPFRPILLVSAIDRFYHLRPGRLGVPPHIQNRFLGNIGGESQRPSHHLHPP